MAKKKKFKNKSMGTSKNSNHSNKANNTRSSNIQDNCQNEVKPDNVPRRDGPGGN